MGKKLTDDVLKFIVEIDGKPAQQGLNLVEQETRKLEKSNKSLATEMAKLEANGKKGTAEWKAYEAQIKQNNTSIGELKKKQSELRQEVGISNLTIKQLGQEYKRLKQAQSDADPNSKEWKQYDGQLRAVKGRLNELNGVQAKTNSLFGSLKTLMPAMGIAAGIALFSRLKSKIFDTRAEFEKYEAVLTNTFGSQEKARKEMDMLVEFAAKTPFQLNELTGSFVKLTNYGLQPSRGELTKLGDLASSVGKSFDQLAEALADSVTGENERLKEFGIRAQKHGDKISYTFKGITTEVDNNAQAIKEYILGLGGMEGVAGSMAAISKTMGGQASNLADNFDRMWNNLGKGVAGGLITGSIQGMNSLLDVINELLEKPINKDFWKYLLIITSAVVSYYTAIKIAASWTKIVSAYETVYIAVLYAKDLAISVLTGKVKLATIAQRAWNIVQKANPIGLIVGILIAAGTALALYTRKLSAAEAAQKELNDITIASKKAIVGEKVEMENLLRIARDEKISKADRIAAIKKLNELSPEYLGGLTLEKINTEDATTATENYITALEKKAKMQAANARLEEIEGELLDLKLSGKGAELTLWQKTKIAALSGGNAAIAASKAAVYAVDNLNQKEKDLLEGKKKILEIIQETNRETNGEDPKEKIDSIKTLKEELTKLNAARAEIDITDKAALKTNAKEIADLEKKIKLYEDLGTVKAGSEKPSEKPSVKQLEGDRTLAELEINLKKMEALKAKYAAAPLPIKPEEDNVPDPELDYIIEKIKKTFAYKRASIQEDYKTGVIGRTQYNDEIAALDQEEVNFSKLKLTEKLEYAIEVAKQIASVMQGIADMANQNDQNELNSFKDTQDKKKAILQKQLDNGLISQESYNAQIDSMNMKLQEKEREMANKKAKRDKEMALFNASINIAEAVTKMLTAGPIAGQILAGITAAMGLVEIGVIAGTKVPQYSEGNLMDVIGAQSGKRYKAAISTGKSGIYSQPTFLPGLKGLAGEKEPELVLSGAHTRNIQNNYPELMDAIVSTMPEYARGNYSTVTERTYEKSFTDPRLVKSMDAFTAVMDRIERNGLSVPWNLIDEKNTKMKNLTESVRIK